MSIPPVLVYQEWLGIVYSMFSCSAAGRGIDIVYSLFSCSEEGRGIDIVYIFCY